MKGKKKPTTKTNQPTVRMIQTERNIKSMFPEARNIAQLIRELEARDPKFDFPVLYKRVNSPCM